MNDCLSISSEIRVIWMPMDRIGDTLWLVMHGALVLSDNILLAMGLLQDT